MGELHRTDQWGMGRTEIHQNVRREEDGDDVRAIRVRRETSISMLLMEDQETREQ